MKKSKLLVNSKSASAQTSIVFMILAAVFILMGTLLGTVTKAWAVLTPFSISNGGMVSYFALPLLAAVLFALCVLFLGKKAFYLSAVPVLLAIVSTMIKGFEMGTATGYIELVVCIALIALYCCTVLGIIPRVFFVALSVILLVYHTYFAVYTGITTSNYKLSQLSCEIGILFLYVGFITAICGATKQRTIDLSKATTVAPPIPGGYGLGEIKNEAVTAPEPVAPVMKKEPVVPATEEAPVAPVVEEPVVRKYYTGPIFSEAAIVLPEEVTTVVEDAMPVVEPTVVEEEKTPVIAEEEKPVTEEKKTTRKRTTRTATKKKTEEAKK